MYDDIFGDDDPAQNDLTGFRHRLDLILRYFRRILAPEGMCRDCDLFFILLGDGERIHVDGLQGKLVSQNLGAGYIDGLKALRSDHDIVFGIGLHQCIRIEGESQWRSGQLYGGSLTGAIGGQGIQRIFGIAGVGDGDSCIFDGNESDRGDDTDLQSAGILRIDWFRCLCGSHIGSG